MSARTDSFRRPNVIERFFNRAFGLLVGLGFGLRHSYLIQVRGRKAGRMYSTPVDLLELQGKRFLVAPRGKTDWVRNAEAAGEVILKKGRSHRRFRMRAIPDGEKPEVLKAYLDRFAPTVEWYFPVPAGSPMEAFAGLAAGYPAFDLLPAE